MIIIFLCLGLISLTCLKAQEKFFKLKQEPVDIELKDFYIEKVLDGRSNKENIGIAQVGF